VTPRRLIILGSTGSIGTQALEVVAHLNALADRGEFPHHLRVVGLAAGGSARTLLDQAARFGVQDLALARPPAGLRAPAGLRTGPDAASRLVREVECDLVLAAMVGAAGLPATLAAIDLGRDIALANKETLVAAGALVVPAARRSGSRLLPVDSEHAGLWQCLASRWNPDAAPPIDAGPDIRRVTLTASGGPFRTLPAAQIRAATPAMALRHPTWAMGPKVTIDSASLANKALEIIEAHWLFGLDADRIDAVVHPQSHLHALVEFADGSTVAQFAPPDMRCPIQLALAWPHRPPGLTPPLPWSALAGITLEPVDHARFPLLALAHRAIRAGGTAGAILNAANEAAVAAFLGSDGSVTFGAMVDAVLAAVDRVPVSPLNSLEDFHAADAAARAAVAGVLAPAPGPARV
jgi:1-deoxy-D-xylulose-5-phosphate reductoisomerase